MSTPATTRGRFRFAWPDQTAHAEIASKPINVAQYTMVSSVFH